MAIFWGKKVLIVWNKANTITKLKLLINVAKGLQGKEFIMV